MQFLFSVPKTPLAWALKLLDLLEKLIWRNGYGRARLDLIEKLIRINECGRAILMFQCLQSTIKLIHSLLFHFCYFNMHAAKGKKQDRHKEMMEL